MTASSPHALAMAMASSARARRSLEGAAVGQFRTQGGEHEGPVGTFGGKPIEGHLQGGDLVGVDIPHTGHPASVVGQHRRHQPLGVMEVRRPSRTCRGGCRERRGPRSGAGRCRARWSGRGRATGSGAAEPGVEVQGLGVVAQSVGGGESGQRGVTGLARVRDGLSRSMGWVADPVAGQLAHPCARPVPTKDLEGFGHLAMGSSPAVGTHVLVERARSGHARRHSARRYRSARERTPQRRRPRGGRAGRPGRSGWRGRAARGRSRAR